MTAGTGNGLGTAVELLGGFGDLGIGEGEQPELFADADDAPGPLAPAAPAKRPAHRPKGSRNRSTEEWRQFVLGRHRSPLLVLAETWSRSAEDLARELGLVTTVPVLAPGQQALKTVYYSEDHPTQPGEVRGYLVWDRLEAFRVQQGAAVAALPYLHQKQPMALEVKQTTRGVVILGSLDVDDTGDGDGFALPMAPEQNQRVIDVEPEKSHGSQSHDAPNPLEQPDE